MFSQLHHLSKNFSTANILGMVLTLIGLIIGAVNVADAYDTAQVNAAQTNTAQTDTNTDTDAVSAPTGSTGLSSNTGLSSMLGNAADLATGTPVTVEQGMRISMSSEDDSLLALVRPLQFCTLGYIDHANRVGYTSAHCLPGVDEGTYNGGGVAVTTREQRPIGIAYPANAYRENGPDNATDIAIIHFNDDVKLGKNIYSGNTVLTLDDIDIEKDTFCAFGATTQRVQCGKWNTDMGGTNPTTAFYIFGAHTIDGDSGSGVWVKGKDGKPRGLFGISRGRYHIPEPNAAGAIFASVDQNDFERPADK